MDWPEIPDPGNYEFSPDYVRRSNLLTARAGHLAAWLALGGIGGWAFSIGALGGNVVFAALVLTLPATLLYAALRYSWSEMEQVEPEIRVFGETSKRYLRPSR